MNLKTEKPGVNPGESAGLGFGEVRDLCAMDLFTIAVDAETMGKICKLARQTKSVPTNDEAEDMACALLDAALDAALESCTEVGSLTAKTKLAIIQPPPAPRRRKGQVAAQ